MNETVIVGTGDLRQALASVRVHASTDKENPSIHRVRLALGGRHLAVSATDRFTNAIAIVSLWSEEGAHEVCGIDLLPDDVGKILSFFQGGKGGNGGAEPEHLLRLELLDGHVLITDCSGMIDGRALKVPRLSTVDTDLGKVTGLIYRYQDARTRLIDDVAVSGDSLARFQAASKAYGEPLVIEGKGAPGGRAPVLLVRCGESFLGLMTSRTIIDGQRQQLTDWAAGWGNRLPAMADEARLIDEGQAVEEGAP
ncbi:hypothetical protein [Nocardia sp. NPDC058633]|uniref:hypothetical protein n=1 Tax=Nocardia sp. NPDC058633 TaxID=3346568 RepID=UPI0036578F81